MDRVDIDQPLLFAPRFHSFEEDSEREEDLLESVEFLLLRSGFEAQVVHVFGMDLGPLCGKEVIKHSKIVVGWNRCGQGGGMEPE